MTLIEGSNTQRHFFSQTHDLSGSENWGKITDKHIDWFTERGCVVRDINCKAGDLVLWDSRTAHAGKEALKNRAERNFRAVAYLCYTPREIASDSQLKKKQEALKNHRTTSHIPHNVKLFGLSPRLYPGQTLQPSTPVPNPILTPLGKRLAGYK